MSRPKTPFEWGLRRASWLVALLAFPSWGCSKDASGGEPPRDTAEAQPSEPAASVSADRPAPREPAAAELATTPGDPVLGKKLVAKFECNRCHDGTGLAAAPRAQHCTHCHADIMRGAFPAPPAVLARWKKTVEPHRRAPSLAALGERFRPEWLEHFLLDPVDLRPALAPNMPRLALDPTEARHIVAYLTRQTEPTSGSPPKGGDARRGRRLFEEKNCGSCHVFSGAGLGAKSAPKRAQHEDGPLLAPDLRFTRQRFRPERLVAWLEAPQRIKPDTLMPNHQLTPAQAQDLATFVLSTPLQAIEKKTIPERLPLLSRRVTYDEVYKQVLGVTCRHCHSDPDVSMGDGGPGNTGGFGFSPRKLNVATYESISAGFIDDGGERHSVFQPQSFEGAPFDSKEGTPTLVAALLARQAEEAGQPVAGIRGMPLALPALSPEQIQLVASWVAQGRPR